MSEIVEKIKLEQVSALRKSAGQNESKIANAAMVFESIPESGTFSHIGTKEFDIPTVGKRTSFGLFLTTGQFISENALNQQNLLSELAEIKSNAKGRKGKFILKSVRLSDFNKFGNSADERIVNLQGKTYKAVKLDNCRVYKSEVFEAPENFERVVFAKADDKALKSALELTETKVCNIFNIED